MNPDVRQIAKHGDATAVISLLSSPDPLVRYKVMRAIKKRRLTEAAPVLQRLAATGDKEVKVAALLALEQLALPETRATFQDALTDETVRPTALRGLFAIGDPRAIAAAEDAYRTGNRITRQVALFCLNRTATPETIDALQGLLDGEPSWRWRRRIRKDLRQAKSKGPRPMWRR